MIKTKKMKVNVEEKDYFVCDNCGMAINADAKDFDVAKFKKEHKKCKMPKNPNL